jgi:hypothetical protein
LLLDCEDNQEEEYQDIYFFKKTLRLISSILSPYAKDDMLVYLLDNIKFLYINIPKPETGGGFKPDVDGWYEHNYDIEI